MAQDDGNVRQINRREEQEATQRVVSRLFPTEFKGSKDVTRRLARAWATQGQKTITQSDRVS